MHRTAMLFFGVVIGVVFLFSGREVKASATDDLHGWAWSENIGWVSFNCANLGTCPPAGTEYGVDFDAAGQITGWAWSENIGWICFGATCGGTAPDGLGAAASVSLVSGQMRGWARFWSLGDSGWISLSCVDLGICGTADYRVTVNFVNGAVSGWAWNGNSDGSGIGWLDWKFATVALVETICDNGLDDDGDSLIDCSDSDCHGQVGGSVGGNPVYCQFGNETGANCSDYFNNDADSYTDCWDQSSCWHSAPNCPVTEINCSDGQDNDDDDGNGNWDANGLTGRDCLDYDCAGNPACPGTEISCVDGIDNDLDRNIDCADSDCAGECTSTCSLNPGRRCRVDADCVAPPPNDGACLVQPWLETRFHNLYSRESISAANPPPSGGYNATYCLISGIGVVSNFLSDPLFGCGMPPPAEAFNFPQTANRYATDLGKIDVTGVLNGNYGQITEITGTTVSGSTALGGRVFYANGDLHIGAPPGMEFRAGTGLESGAGSYLIIGDLYIDGPLTYRVEPAGSLKNLASVGFLVLQRPDGTGGNVIINSFAQEVVGAFYAEGRFNTGGGANPLTIRGLIVAHEFFWGRVYADRLRGAEEIIYDGRAVINPPPGFGDVSKSLPVFKQGIIQ